MKQLLFFIGLTLLINVGCKQKNSNTSTANPEEREQMIAGDLEKTWKAKREENATGDKQSLDRNERQERVTFYRTHKVTMTDKQQSRHGEWSLEDNRMGLKFEESNDQHLMFDIIELNKSSIHLRAADGTELDLKPE